MGRLPDGRAVFVPRTAPGDLVELERIRDHRRFARARPARLLERGADRAEPRCPHYLQDECGGCQMQHLSPAAQRAARGAFVGDALRRIARRDVADPPVEPAPRQYDYRTRITLAVTGGGRQVGLHPYDRPDRVFDLAWCHITAPELMELWQGVRAARGLLPGALRQLILRLDRGGGRHLILKVGPGEVWTGAAALADALARRGLRATIWWQPEDGAARAMAGAEQAFPATVFEQVHPEMGDRVRAFALEALGPVAGCRVWDLYAGIGETTTHLAAAGAAVESVESDPRAVAEAEARGPAARRLVGRVEHVLGALTPPDLVVTNPPRAGMDARVTAELARTAPRRIAYISCDAATLARDLSRMPDYRIARLRAFDLFPQTAHVETVVLLERAP